MSDRKRNLAMLRKRKKEMNDLYDKRAILIIKSDYAYLYYQGKELETIRAKLEREIKEKTEKLVALHYEANFIQANIDKNKN